MDKSISAPVDEIKNKLGSREKHSHSPQKSYVNFNPNGYAHHQHQNMNFGSYSPEIPKCNSSLYPDEYYSHQGSQWQMHNPPAVNMNTTKQPGHPGHYQPYTMQAYPQNMGYYMPTSMPMYKTASGHPPHASRKYSEGVALHGNYLGMQKSNTEFKPSAFPKKNNGRKRVFSSIETNAMFDNKFGKFSGNLSNTKDSSTSSNNKYASPPRKGMPGNQSSDPKSPYLIKLRKCIKDKEEEDLTLEDLKGHASEISRDQVGSRFIQKIYEANCKVSSDSLGDLINEIKEDSLNIMKDVFGNYVIQKILQFGPEEHIQTLFNEIKGHILEMSKHIYGCRVVQRFIEVLNQADQATILSELEGSVMECIYDQYGNHVIQKILKEGHSDTKVDFIQSHIEANIAPLCMHIYG
eukprot:CAMPEP_0197015916 /NCGR_PEP_ID=MMETSP1380-20130617/76151_1 /TAXON_ID=5936 /ORGANISM="Euplotes crassus, Strain CT5" /LENGTH=406 /DNA_ID=CAMNT_0042442253 /DNA_START=120 /DNA_END=1340 /DNA_ORIENTATION=+